MSYTPIRCKRWTYPKDYAGETWYDYYSSGVGQSRDSDDLEKSNFATMLRDLGGESETVLVVSERHWAVGWVEWIAIHESDEKALKIADENLERLENYPVLNETDWCEREWEHAQDNWRFYSLKERIDLCRKYGVSIFAARRDYIPEDDDGSIFQELIRN